MKNLFVLRPEAGATFYDDADSLGYGRDIVLIPMIQAQAVLTWKTTDCGCEDDVCVSECTLALDEFTWSPEIGQDRITDNGPPLPWLDKSTRRETDYAAITN